MQGKRLISVLGNLDVYIAVVGMAALVLLSFIGVITRYFFLRPLSWQEELMVLMLLWIVFFGASYCFRQKSHIAVDLLVDLMPVPVQRVIAVLVQIVVIIVLTYIGFYGYEACMHYAVRHNATNILRVPYSLKYLCVPLGCAMMIVSSTLRLVHDLTAPAGGDGQANGGEVSNV